MLANGRQYGLRVVSAGTQKVVPHSARGVARHCTYLLTTMDVDRAELEIEGRIWSFKHGGTFIVPPAVGVRVVKVSHGRLHWVHFTVRRTRREEEMRSWHEFGLKSPHTAVGMQPGPDAVWGVQLPPQVPEHLKNLFQTEIPEVVGLYARATPAGQIDADGLLGECIHRLVRDLRQREEGGLPDSLERRIAVAELYARQRFGAELTTKDLARVADLNRSYFCEMYRQLRGEAPGAMLARLRMERAALILNSQDLPIGIVAQTVGYPNASAFSRAFKRHFGCVPSEYLKVGSNPVRAPRRP